MWSRGSRSLASRDRFRDRFAFYSYISPRLRVHPSMDYSLVTGNAWHRLRVSHGDGRQSPNCLAAPLLIHLTSPPFFPSLRFLVSSPSILS